MEEDGPLVLNIEFLFSELIENEKFAEKLCKEYNIKNRFFAFDAFCKDKKMVKRYLIK